MFSKVASRPPRSRAHGSARRALGALLLAALAISTLAVAPSASASGRVANHARTTAEYGMAVAVQQQLNAERRAHHLKPVTMNKSLMLSARRHDFAMSSFDEMSHQLPGEPVFTSRIRSAGYHWKWAGENVAWNSQISTNGVLALESMMYAERAPNNGHRLNILSTHYTDVGVDVFIDTTHQRVWLTTDFGSR